jgi:hypothetical protein
MADAAPDFACAPSGLRLPVTASEAKQSRFAYRNAYSNGGIALRASFDPPASTNLPSF